MFISIEPPEKESSAIWSPTTVAAPSTTTFVQNTGLGWEISMTHNPHENLGMFILDVLRHDAIENIESIVPLLNDASGTIGWREFWPHDFTSDEVTRELKTLVQQGLVRPLKEVGGRLEPRSPETVEVAEDLNELWFEMTSRGREKWSTWDPPQIQSSTSEK